MAGLSPIRHTSNPADFQSVDGIYIDEQTPPSRIVGEAIDKVICVGEFERGPVDEVLSFGTARELGLTMGDLGPDAAGAFYTGALALRGKFWSRLHVLRVSNSSQVLATVSLDDDTVPTNVLDVKADSVGVWGNSLKAEIKAATSGVALEFDMEITRDGVILEIHRNMNLADVIDGENLPITSNYVVATRVAIGDGRPVTVAATSLTSGSDGTFTDSDYVGVVGPPATGIKVLYGDAASDIRWVFAAENTSSAVNDELELLATNGDVKNVIIAGGIADTPATVITDVANYRSDRIGYGYPWVDTFIPEANNNTGGLIRVSPTSFVANLLAHMAPGQNPAGPNGVKHLKGIRALANPNLTHANMVDFRTNKVMGIQFTKGADEYEIRSGVNTSLDPALHNWARRTMTDFITLSVSNHLLTFRNDRINRKNKLELVVAVTDFLDGLILTGDLPGKADLNEFRAEGSQELLPYEIDITSLNTPAQEASGLFYLTLRVRIFATMDNIVFRTEIGEGVEIVSN